MKVHYLLPVLFFVSCLISIAELSKDELKKLRDVEIAGTRTDTWKNDNREKYEAAGSATVLKPAPTL